MSAGVYRIWCEQGATFNLPLQWNDSTGNGVNLSGYTAKMQVRTDLDSTSPLVELSTANGRIALTITGGITLTIDATTTGAFAIGQYVYDLELTSGTNVFRLLQGFFVVNGNVTR
jgi:hypothetical protein